MHFKFSFIVLVLFVSGCAHKKAIQNHDVFMAENPSLISPEKIGADEIQDDLSFLQRTFDAGYIGFYFQPAQIKMNFVQQLAKLADASSGGMSTQEFCLQLSNILREIPDNHLEAQRNGNYCSPDSGSSSGAKNMARNAKNQRFWVLEQRKVKEKTIPVLGITKFPDPNDLGWSGFRETFTTLSESPAMIIDLRGNTGGHLGMGAWMANMLGEKDLSPWTKALDLRTAAAISIERNATILKKKNYLDAKKEVPLWLTFQLKEPLPAATGGLVEVPRNLSSDYHKPYAGKLYVLMDRDCGSTCEAAVLLLKRIANTRVIGQKSAGAYGYGNAGLLLLPNSKILLQVPTRAFVHPKDLYEERRGLIPDIAVSEKEDALEVALALIGKNP